MNPERITNLADAYPIALRCDQPADGPPVYTAWLMDLPGCLAEGANTRQTVQRLRDAAPAYLRRLQDLGVELPPPSDPPGVIVEDFGFQDPVTGARPCGTSTR